MTVHYHRMRHLVKCKPYIVFFSKVALVVSLLVLTVANIFYLLTVNTEIQQSMVSSYGHDPFLSGQRTVAFHSPWDQIAYDAKGGVILREEAIIKAWLRPEKVHLAIGMTTVQRVYKTRTADYVENTLKSLLSPIRRKDTYSLLIITLIADSSLQTRMDAAQRLNSAFESYVESGIMHLIHIPQRYYLPITGKRRTFNDSEARVRWRGKQSLDYAFLFQYAFGISDYYMHMEDDVLAHEEYFNIINEDLARLYHSRKKWIMLDYSGQGFIGKLIKNKDLLTYSTVLRIYYEEMPCDFTYQIVNYVALGRQYIHALLRKRLFRHVGNLSSSAGT